LIGLATSVYSTVAAAILEACASRFLLITDVSFHRSALFVTKFLLSFAFDYLLFIPVTASLSTVISLEGWIKKAGSVILTLSLVNVFTKPCLELLVSWGTRQVNLLLDRGRLVPSAASRARNHLEYSNVHLRPQVKYSAIYSHMLQSLWGLLLYIDLLPGLAFIACIGFLIDYWAKKVLLFHLEDNHNTRDLRLLKDFTEGFFWGLLGHFLVGYLLE
jgi:hypothetical protein